MTILNRNAKHIFIILDMCYGKNVLCLLFRFNCQGTRYNIGCRKYEWNIYFYILVILWVVLPFSVLVVTWLWLIKFQISLIRPVMGANIQDTIPLIRLKPRLIHTRKGLKYCKNGIWAYANDKAIVIIEIPKRIQSPIWIPINSSNTISIPMLRTSM